MLFIASTRRERIEGEAAQQHVSKDLIIILDIPLVLHAFAKIHRNRSGSMFYNTSAQLQRCDGEGLMNAGGRFAFGFMVKRGCSHIGDVRCDSSLVLKHVHVSLLPFRER